ncbi:MAG: hypothetical protein VKL00_06405 [Synechococcales bacterium]|nr:hypothetical protein [Cyanobacteria bacterium REEB444]MEB3125250.1 hypothetical protein [Synechococcales bacterium]
MASSLHDVGQLNNGLGLTLITSILNDNIPLFLRRAKEPDAIFGGHHP